MCEVPARLYISTGRDVGPLTQGAKTRMSRVYVRWSIHWNMCRHPQSCILQVACLDSEEERDYDASCHSGHNTHHKREP